jgi:hypothetical protein
VAIVAKKCKKVGPTRMTTGHVLKESNKIGAVKIKILVPENDGAFLHLVRMALLLQE